MNLLENSVLDDRGYLYKKYCLNFGSVVFFFLLFLVSTYKMVDNI